MSTPKSPVTLRAYSDAQDLLEAFGQGLHISWTVAHDAEYVNAWAYRWTHLEAEIDGMQDALIFVVGAGEAYDYVVEGLQDLKRIAAAHSMNFEHLPFGSTP